MRPQEIRDGVPLDGSLRRWTISATGVSGEIMIVDQNHQLLEDKDFDAYNLELIINDLEETVVAWTNATEDSAHNQTVDRIIIVKDGSPQIYDLNYGRIGGIEFSSYEENVLYASCTDIGIVKVDFTNYNQPIISTITGSGDYARTYLQTAPDGHIYGVSNDGQHLCKIDMQTGIFSAAAFDFPDYTSVSAYREFSDGSNNIKYYNLPENDRQHNPPTAIENTTDVSCPGASDGTATIYITGGTPGEDPEFTIVCTGPNGENVEPADYNEDENYFYFDNLYEGIYTYIITDSWELTFEGSFVIDVDEDLYDFPEIVDVDYNQTWTAYSYTYEVGIIIRNQKELIIENSILEFGPNAKIIIEPGAKLTIDNSTLTNLNCEPQHLWQGIEVWGNKAVPQLPDDDGFYPQGYLVLDLGTVIENAVIAVDLWNPGNWGTTGGIVFANGGSGVDEEVIFRNNAQAVHALHYRNFNPYNTSQEWDYLSNFKYCTFEITENYLGSATFYKHIDLAHVRGIDFQACEFNLAENVASISEWNHAIAGYNAQFRVSAICTTYPPPQNTPCPEIDLDKCTFTGFYSAVNAINDGTSPVSFSVNQAIFNNNAYGVKTQMMKNSTVLFSDFNIGQKDGCGRGIYLENATGFAFEENNFAKFTGAPTADYFGIHINKTEAINEVYNNNFNGVSYANYSEGKNWIGRDRFKGLTYFCNENTNNYADFYVEEAYYSGIQSKQGDDDHVAGNTFSQSGATWHFFNNKLEHLVGYYFCDYCTGENPDDDKLNEVTDKPESFENSCPSHYGGGTGLKLILTAQQKLDAELVYYDNLADYNSVKALYDSYIDGGNTPSEILDIQTAQPEDMWALRAQLLGDSPHLSMEVLMEAADKTDVFTESALFDILAANPDELTKDELIQYLEDKENPLPDYMIDILKQLAEGTTYKTILQMQMAWYAHNYTRAAHEIIRSNINSDVSDYTELRNWLDNLGGITSDRQIITTYIHEGNFTDALTLANMLPQLHDLDGEELIEHNYYIDMINFFQTLNQQGRNTYQLTGTEKADLELMAINSNGVAGSQAKSILEAAYNMNFASCPEVDGTAGHKSSNVSIDNLGMVYGLDISVKPNPANQWAAFDYTLPEKASEATIIITDVTGKTIDVLDVTGQQGQKLWDTRKFKPGVYLYTLKTAGFIKSGKIVISK